MGSADACGSPRRPVARSSDSVCGSVRHEQFRSR